MQKPIQVPYLNLLIASAFSLAPKPIAQDGKPFKSPSKTNGSQKQNLYSEQRRGRRSPAPEDLVSTVGDPMGQKHLPSQHLLLSFQNHGKGNGQPVIVATGRRFSWLSYGEMTAREASEGTGKQGITALLYWNTAFNRPWEQPRWFFCLGWIRPRLPPSLLPADGPSPLPAHLSPLQTRTFQPTWGRPMLLFDDCQCGRPNGAWIFQEIGMIVFGRCRTDHACYISIPNIWMLAFNRPIYGGMDR